MAHKARSLLALYLRNSKKFPRDSDKRGESVQGEGKALLRCINYHVSLVCIFALGVRVILAHLAVLIQNYWSCGQEVVFFQMYVFNAFVYTVY